MAHEIETMMYAADGGRPWHGLGNAIDIPPADVATALALAGLDWTVEKQQLFLADGRPAPRFATVRASDGAILGTVGDDYTVLQNAEAFAPLGPVIEEGLATVESGGSLRGGSRVWMLLRMRSSDVAIAGDDVVRKYLLAAQGHDGSLSVFYGPTATRVVCQNTLSASIRGDRKNMVRFRHTQSIAAGVEAARAMIAAIDAKLDAACEVFRAFAGRTITGAQLKAYVDAVFPAPKKVAPPVVETDDLASLLARPARITVTAMHERGEMTDETSRRIHSEICDLYEGRGRGSDLPGSKGTLWGAYNAVTEYLTHHRGRSDDNRANNLWFGDIGTRAVQAAQDILTAS